MCAVFAAWIQLVISFWVTLHFIRMVAYHGNALSEYIRTCLAFHISNDQDFGFHPYTTWSTTTGRNAQLLIREHGLGEYELLGVIRTYQTRHGYGPFPTEDPAYAHIDNDHNGTGIHQGAFRRGHLDLPALRYAIDACGGIDGLVVTHNDVADSNHLYLADSISAEYRFGGHPDDLIARELHTHHVSNASYQLLTNAGQQVRASAETIAECLNVTLVLTGHGPAIPAARWHANQPSARTPARVTG